MRDTRGSCSSAADVYQVQSRRPALRNDRTKVYAAPLSPFCVGELARQRRGRTLAEIQLDETGAPSVETCARAAIRRPEGCPVYISPSPRARQKSRSLSAALNQTTNDNLTLASVLLT